MLNGFFSKFRFTDDGTPFDIRTILKLRDGVSVENNIKII
jgi:hypothetical protein